MAAKRKLDQFISAPPGSQAGTINRKAATPVTANDKIQGNEAKGQYVKPYVGEEEVQYIQTLEEKQAAKELYDRYYWLRKARKNVLNKNMETVWDMAEKNITNYVQQSSTDEDRSNLFIPITHTVIDSIMAEWMGSHTTGKVKPKNNEDAIPKAVIMDLIRESVEKKNQVDLLDSDLHWNILTYGNGYQEILYKLGKRKFHDITGMDAEGNPTYKEVVKDAWDDISIENVDNRFLFPDDNARKPDVSDWGDYIHRKIVVMGDFEVEYSMYPNWKYVRAGGDITEIDYFTKPRDLEDYDVEVLWWWNKKRDFLRITANGVLLCDIPNPYDHKELPIAGAGDNKRPGSIWWMGEAELIEPLQEETNVTRNIRVDGSRMATLSPIFAPTTGRLEEDEMIVEPGKIYYYQGTQPPTQLKSQIDFSSSYQNEEALKLDVITTTGVDTRPNTQSTGSATGDSILREKSLKRIAKKLRQCQMMLERRRGKLEIELIKQYYTVPKIEMVVGPDNIEDYAEAEQRIKEDPDHYFKAEDQNIYKKAFRQIRIDNRAVEVAPKYDNHGKMSDVQVKVKQIKGYTFFEAKPALFNDEYDFDVIPDTDMPVTAAQKKQDTLDMYDRLSKDPVINSPDGKMYIQTAQGQVAVPMPKGRITLAKKLVESYGENIDDYLPEEGDDDAMLAQAAKENVAMMAGEPFGPTPLASPAHTMVHEQFMQDHGITKEANPKLFEVFTKHIIGEIDFQKKMAMQAQIGTQQQEALAANNSQNQGNQNLIAQNGQTPPNPTGPAIGGGPGGSGPVPPQPGGPAPAGVPIGNLPAAQGNSPRPRR